MGQAENKICQNCKQNFTVEAEDFGFYERIKVPAPTWCPKCRLQRRLSRLNLINLYKRKCDLCKEEKISIYPPEAPYKIYCTKCWWSDKWDPYEYGRDYDFSRPFFEQFDELLHEVPLLGLSVDSTTIVASPYVNQAGNLKNCYLLFWANFSEDCAYGFYLTRNKTVVDCSNLILCEWCYDLFHAYKSNHSTFSYDLLESISCAFLRDSENCQDCFGSANLRNKKYHIFNKPYTREAYAEEMEKWDLGSYRTYEKARELVKAHWKKFPPMPMYEKFNVNCTGNRIYESKNCQNCFEVAGAENCKYVSMLINPPTEDCYDILGWGNNLSNSYECSIVGEDSSDLKFCDDCGGNLLNAEYCKQPWGGSYLFGCVSLKKGKYSIFNKRYSEEEFWKLRERIVKHMDDMPYTDKKGRVYRYGEFFPIALSPHAYNETLASKFFPLTKEEMLANGYKWREPDTRDYQITKSPSDLPDHTKDVTDDILKETIGCAVCSKGFKIAQFELDFLRKMNLPLPRWCPFCRIGDKLDAWVKESNLVKRVCDTCGVEFQTPHAREEAPYILCKQCYLKEVV